MRRAAFTLIELLVVVAVISILAAIALPNFLAAQTRAKVSRAKADMRAITTGFESYRVDHNAYPPDYDSGIYGFGVASEWMSYARLTTPVAYLTNAPLDVFRVGASLPKAIDFFEYWGGDAVIGTNPSGPVAQAWLARGVHWGIYTVGPDQRDQYLVRDLPDSILNAYDATNGSVSRGDIGRTNVSLLPVE